MTSQPPCLLQAQYHYGDVITFACHFGYELQGAGTLQCTAEGQWNGTVPTCQCQCTVHTRSTPSTEQYRLAMTIDVYLPRIKLQ